MTIGIEQIIVFFLSLILTMGLLVLINLLIILYFYFYWERNVIVHLNERETIKESGEILDGILTEINPIKLYKKMKRAKLEFEKLIIKDKI